MAITKSEFFQAGADTLRQSDEMAMRLMVQDPFIVQPLGAYAQMLAMLSSQIDIASSEPFEKTRDTTVYADAALKGVMPYSRAGLVSVRAFNGSYVDMMIEAGRVFSDEAGRNYWTTSPMAIPAMVGSEKGEALITLTQSSSSEFSSVVTESTAFQTIKVEPPANEEESLSSISVFVDGEKYNYTKDFMNVLAGDHCYHIEMDEYRNILVKFGMDGVVGSQPSIGQTVRVVTEQTFGEIDGSAGDAFTLNTVIGVESALSFQLESILDAGAAPIGIDVLRELVKYPSIYSDNAVYLGSFDAMIRRHVSDLQFLSVWNEQIEEGVRGASQDNINKLFISFEPKSSEARAGVQSLITKLIKKADDGYRLKFILPTASSPIFEIEAKVSVSNDAAIVKTQIEQVLLSKYGKGTADSKRGLLDFRNKDVTALLVSKIEAFNDYRSDFSVRIKRQSSLLPEHWQYLSLQNIHVTVSSVMVADNAWGA